jgi:hypothetical protein
MNRLFYFVIVVYLYIYLILILVYSSTLSIPRRTSSGISFVG